ncbi:MAG: glucose-6-phosphate isomerase, partial [Methylococcales bacterium]|nr:glucose-6-phosphate isomerase [Methylococcales bacterium]
MTQFTEYPSFNALTEHFSRINQIHLRTHFAQNPSRCNQFSIEFNNFLFDYSKNHITQETIDLLLKFAEE